MIKESVGQRGVTAQRATEKYLKELNTRYVSFTWERLPDARAAGGRMKKAISDYLCWYLPLGGHPRCMPLEVKSTEHEYRLKSDAVSQLPKLRLVAKCGGYCYVLVLFKTIEKWRIAPVSYFTPGVPSWDMRDLPLFDSPRDALNSTGIFPVL